MILNNHKGLETIIVVRRDVLRPPHGTDISSDIVQMNRTEVSKFPRRN